MIYSNLARGIAREFEPRSIRDIFVVDGCVAGSAFDLNKQRTVEFEIGPTLTPGDAEWLRQILA